MEGVEIKEFNLSDTLDNKDFRIDSDFWSKEHKKNDILKYGRIGNYLKNAQYGISISMNENKVGYPIYRMNEIHNMLCDLAVNKYADISTEEFNKFKLNDRDVLFNRTNSYEWVGRTGLYRKINDSEYTFASYLVRFIPDENVIMPEYLVAFLNTKYGIREIKRRSRRSINQTNVNPEEVKEIFIPLLSNYFQKHIRNMFENSHLYRLKAHDLYTSSEKILIEFIGLNGLKHDTDPINIKSFKDSFLSTGRLDAEYYQKKYEEYINLILRNINGFELIETICTIKDKNFTPIDNEEYRYIELSDIGSSGEITSCTTLKGCDLPSRARRRVNTNDVLISTIEGSLNSCAIVTDEYNNALCSTGFYVINSKTINSETLLVLFKSKLMQNLLKQSCSGTILTAINKSDFNKLYIPIIDKNVQDIIKAKVTESFKLKNKSNELLETAKRAVEIAIEEDETAALKYIEEKLNIIDHNGDFINDEAFNLISESTIMK